MHAPPITPQVDPAVVVLFAAAPRPAGRRRVRAEISHTALLSLAASAATAGRSDIAHRGPAPELILESLMAVGRRKAPPGVELQVDADLDHRFAIWKWIEQPEYDDHEELALQQLPRIHYGATGARTRNPLSPGERDARRRQTPVPAAASASTEPGPEQRAILEKIAATTKGPTDRDTEASGPASSPLVTEADARAAERLATTAWPGAASMRIPAAIAKTRLLLIAEQTGTAEFGLLPRGAFPPEGVTKTSVALDRDNPTISVPIPRTAAGIDLPMQLPGNKTARWYELELARAQGTPSLSGAWSAQLRDTTDANDQSPRQAPTPRETTGSDAHSVREKRHGLILPMDLASLMSRNALRVEQLRNLADTLRDQLVADARFKEIDLLVLTDPTGMGGLWCWLHPAPGPAEIKWLR
jgi:hypothetical protein